MGNLKIIGTVASLTVSRRLDLVHWTTVDKGLPHRGYFKVAAVNTTDVFAWCAQLSGDQRDSSEADTGMTSEQLRRQKEVGCTYILARVIRKDVVYATRATKGVALFGRNFVPEGRT